MGIYRTLLEEEVPHITDNNDTDEQMKELIDAEYAAGRNSIWGDDELDNMIRLIDRDKHREFVAFGRLKKGK